jgi:hypothetical protein
MVGMFTVGMSDGMDRSTFFLESSHGMAPTFFFSTKYRAVIRLPALGFGGREDPGEHPGEV